jgi:hypothetical protein
MSVEERIIMRSRVDVMRSRVPGRFRRASPDRLANMPPGTGFALAILSMVSLYVGVAAIIVTFV